MSSDTYTPPFDLSPEDAERFVWAGEFRAPEIGEWYGWKGRPLRNYLPRRGDIMSKRFILRKLPEPSAAPTPAPAPRAFQVGDRVKVVRKSGWRGWHPNMDRYVGDGVTRKVEYVESGGIQLVGGGQWWFPPESLELVTDAAPLPEDSPVKVRTLPEIRRRVIAELERRLVKDGAADRFERVSKCQWTTTPSGFGTLPDADFEWRKSTFSDGVLSQSDQPVAATRGTTRRVSMKMKLAFAIVCLALASHYLPEGTGAWVLSQLGGIPVNGQHALALCFLSMAGWGMMRGAKRKDATPHPQRPHGGYLNGALTRIGLIGAAGVYVLPRVAELLDKLPGAVG